MPRRASRILQSVQENVQLTTNEAVDLAHALVSRVADLHGIRTVFIKGPSFAFHNLRAPRTSADVDVLVDPARVADLTSALAEYGWRARDTSLAHRTFTTHAESIVHPSWPIDIDVHDSYPGILSTDHEAFEVIWRSRAQMPIAGQQVLVAGHGASVIIMMLHALRNGERDQRLVRELSHLTDSVAPQFSEAQRAEVAETARALGTVSTLGDALTRAAGLIEAPAWEALHPKLLAWRRRTSTDEVGAQLWFKEFVEAPWRSRPRVLRSALWPSAHDLLLDHPELDRPGANLAAFRIARIFTGVARMPRVLRAWLTSRRDAPPK